MSAEVGEGSCLFRFAGEGALLHRARPSGWGSARDGADGSSDLEVRWKVKSTGGTEARVVRLRRKCSHLEGQRGAVLGRVPRQAASCAAENSRGSLHTPEMRC